MLILIIITVLCMIGTLVFILLELKEDIMSNDPYSWFNIDRLDRMIKKQKEEFKKKNWKQRREPMTKCKG